MRPDASLSDMSAAWQRTCPPETVAPGRSASIAPVEPPVVWTPSEERIARATITRYREWLERTRGLDLPDYVYFDHSIHIHKGIGCNDCHGPVDRMPLMYAAATLQMEWCMNCHRAPEKFLRPREEVFNMRYQQPTSRYPVSVDGKTFTTQTKLGDYLKTKYYLRTVQDITSCSTCHR